MEQALRWPNMTIGAYGTASASLHMGLAGRLANHSWTLAGPRCWVTDPLVAKIILLGSNIRSSRRPAWSRSSVAVSCGGLVLVGEAAEDLFSPDLVLGEVDLRWPGASLSWRELAEGTVRPGGVVMQEVLGQHPAQMVLINDQQRSKSSRRSVPIILSQIALDNVVNYIPSR
jgi:hypothetical protein